MVARLGLWLREARTGVAAVAYREPDTAAAARRRLRPRNRRAQTFTLPAGLTGRQTAVALIEAVEANAGGVLHVVGWEDAFGGPRIGERLYDLNFLRESILEPRTAQVWWMPVAFRDAFMLLAIDTWSMVRLKPMLAYDDEYVDVPPRVAERVRSSLGLSPHAPVPRRRLAEVTEFSAYFSSLSDADLRFLANMPALSSLALEGTPIIDVSPLSALETLKRLNLRKTHVSDIASLASLTNLKSLDIDGNPISDISPLSNLQTLEELDLRGTLVTDVSPLSGLAHLKTLSLWNTPIVDVSPLAGSMGLASLDLGSTNVSDISPLVGLVTLDELNLWGSKVSLADLHRIEDALPNCDVLY